MTSIPFRPLKFLRTRGNRNCCPEWTRCRTYGRGLPQKKGKINPNTALVPNGVDYEAYSTTVAEPADLASIPRPRVGYTGWIKRHIDWDLVLRLAGQHPEWSFVLVGPQSPHPEISDPIRELSKRRNVYLLGAKSTTELTRYPQHFDVCIMPYAVNDYTKYIYPLKLHEYLASGRPTVGTRIRSLENFSEVVGLARTLEEWSAELRRALSPASNAPECFSARQSVARRHDWHVLVEEIALIMAQRLGGEFFERVQNGTRVGMKQAELAVAAALPVPSAIASFPEERLLDRALLQGIAWTGTMKAAIQVMSWASTLIVARLLLPADYGLVGMATVYLGLVSMVNEFGFGSAVVTQRELTDDKVAQLNTLCVLLGALGFAFSCAVSGLLAAFFGAPELRLVVVAMSAIFLITGFQTVPYSLLQRDLQFKLLAISEGLQSFVQALTMVVLAVLGFHYWTLVIGSLVGAITSTIMLVVSRSHPFRRPRLAPLKEAITFSWHILVSRISWYLYSNSDFLVAGRVLGKAALGSYTFAWDLASIPVDKISALVGRVTPAIFSAVQTDRAALRRYLLNLTQGLALVTIPATWGVGLIAEELVRVVLGEKWLAAVLPLQILAAYASLRSITTLLAQVLNVTGQSRFVMYNNIVGLVILPTLFLMGSQWGTTGIATAWVFGFPCVAIPLYRRVFRTLRLSTAQYLGTLWPMLSSSFVMLLFILMMKITLPSSWPLALRLVVEILLGSGAYAGTLGIFHRETFRNFRQLVRKVTERDPTRAIR